MQITETEYVALIRMSSRENVVQATFGPSGVALLDTPSNNWAINIVKSKRSDANLDATLQSPAQLSGRI